jgi:hypothetical protein
MELPETESFATVKMKFVFLSVVISCRCAVVKPAAFVLMLLEVAVPPKLR